MAKHDKNRSNSILIIAKQHFLTYGFKDTSLRAIAKEAGITVSNIYTYFKSKEDIFDVLVKETAEHFFSLYLEQIKKYDATSTDTKIENFSTLSEASNHLIIDYLYQHIEEFKLICLFSKGTKYEHYLDKLIEIELISTSSFVKAVNQEKNLSTHLDEKIIRTLVGFYFNGLTQLIKNDISPQHAKIYMESINTFFIAGWEKLLSRQTHLK